MKQKEETAMKAVLINELALRQKKERVMVYAITEL